MQKIVENVNNINTTEPEEEKKLVLNENNKVVIVEEGEKEEEEQQQSEEEEDEEEEEEEEEEDVDGGADIGAAFGSVLSMDKLSSMMEEEGPIVCFSLTHTRSLSLSLKYTHSLYLFQIHSLQYTFSLTLFFSLSHSLTAILSLSPLLSLSLRYKQFYLNQTELSRKLL